MTDDQWVKERAGELLAKWWDKHSLTYEAERIYDNDVIAALNDAITRTREAERALAAEALRAAHAMQEKAVAAAEKRGYDIGYTRALESREFSLEEAVREGRQSVTDRLKNPDEAMIEAVGAYLMDPDKRIGAKWADIHPEIRDGYAYEARGVIRALAATLDKEE